MDYKEGTYFRILLPKEVPYFPCIPNTSAEIKHSLFELADGELVKIIKKNYSIVETTSTIIVSDESEREFIVSVACADSYFTPIFKKKTRIR